MAADLAPAGLPAICNLCRKSANPCVDVHNDHQRVVTTAELTRMPSWDIRKILSCICSGCLLFIGSLMDSSNILRLSCTNAIKTQNTSNITPLITDPSTNNSIGLFQILTPSPDNVTNSLNVSTQTTSVAIATTPPPCHTKDIANTDVLIESSTRTLSPQDPGQALFEVRYEQNVSPLATESGGVHYRTSNSWPSWIPKPVKRECSYCNRFFRRKTDLRKHYRKCIAERMRYCKSMGTTGRKSIYQDDVQSIASENAQENHVFEINPRPPRHRCSHCPERFQTVLKLKEHTNIHRKQYNCDNCGYNTTAEYSFDMHRVQCIANSEVRRENEETLAGRQHLPARRKTRSYSLYKAVANNNNQARVSTGDMANDTAATDTSSKTKETENVLANTPLVEHMAKSSNLSPTASAKPIDSTRNMTNDTDIEMGNRAQADNGNSLKSKGNVISPLATKQLVCPQCQRSYKRKDHFKKHCARCFAAKSHFAKYTKSLPYENIDESNVFETYPTKSLQHHCTECSVSFKSRFQLSGHMRIHMKLFNCNSCRHRCRTQQQLDMHREECIGIGSDKNQELPARRNTRLYSLKILDMINDNGEEHRAKTAAENDKSHHSGNTEIAVNTRNDLRYSPLTTKKYVCSRCNLSYKRKDHYKKHCDRCFTAQALYAKSTKSLPCENVDVNNLIETAAATSLPPHPCPECSASFNSRMQLRGHMLKHMKLFYCDTCGHKCRTQEQLDEHLIECIELGNGTKTAKQTKPARRITRSYSRYFAYNELISCFENNQTNQNLKRKNVEGINYNNIVTNTKALKLTNSQTCQDGTRSIPTGSTIYSSISNYFQRNEITIQEAHDNNEYVGNDENMECLEDNVVIMDDDDDDDDDEYMYARRLSYTNHWLEKHSPPSILKCDKRKPNLSGTNNDDIPYIFKDLNLLERLRHEVKSKKITCYEPSCGHTTTTITYMMIHDYIDHFKKPRFFCRKCGGCFTSKIFLDYHLDIQDRGHNYRCHRCAIYFSSRHDLHQHLLLHVKQTTDSIENRSCLKCNLVFLDKCSLWKHCVNHKHDGGCRNTSQLIQIDHSRTISNAVATPLKSRTTLGDKNYSVTYMEMHTVPLPRQNLSLVIDRWNTNLCIGKVDFDEPWSANCVRMRRN